MPATLKDIAQRTGVSIAAVSMALKDHPRIGLERRRTIQAVAREMGYEPDMVAQAMRAQRSHTIGMMVSNFRVPVVSIRTDMIEQAIASHGYRVQIAFTQSETARLLQHIRTMRAMRVEGLVVQSKFPDSDTKQIYEELRLCRFPVVLADFWIGTEPPAEFAHVGLNRAQAMEHLVDHLVNTGRRDILFLGADMRGTNGQKLRGVVNACHRHGIRVRYASAIQHDGQMHPLDVKTCQTMIDTEASITVPSLSSRTLYARTRRLVHAIAQQGDRPDAIMATNDELAMITISELQKNGLRVPQDIAVTGYDDIGTAKLFIPPLTTIREPRKTLARTLSSMMLEMLNNKSARPRQITLTPRPMIRHSTLPASR